MTLCSGGLISIDVGRPRQGGALGVCVCVWGGGAGGGEEGEEGG